MSAFDWPGLMRAGLGRLGLLPREFWALTPAELMLMLGDPAGTAPLSRARLAELARAWPDGGPDGEPGGGPDGGPGGGPGGRTDNTEDEEHGGDGRTGRD